jgi:hypothetical protein
MNMQINVENLLWKKPPNKPKIIRKNTLTIKK